MPARGNLVLGEDGKYRMVEKAEEPAASAEDAAPSAGAESSSEAASSSADVPSAGAALNGASDYAHASYEASVRQVDRRTLTTISSSMSGPGIGDDVASKKANLLNGKGTPQVGRRESPEPYDPRPTRMMYAKGLLAGLVVVLVVCAIVIFVGTKTTIG